MFFFFSSTNTKERIQRVEQRLADNEIRQQLIIAKFSGEARRSIAECEIKNLMISNDISHASNVGVNVENIGGNVVFIY
jgi:hypothetical protein